MTIRTRDNLIEFLEENVSGRYLRALQNHNENLGGFSQICGDDTAGWIVRVTSKRRDVYCLAAFEKHFDYLVVILNRKTPWRYWIGDQSKNPLYRGDCFEKYKKLRDLAINENL